MRRQPKMLLPKGMCRSQWTHILTDFWTKKNLIIVCIYMHMYFLQKKKRIRIYIAVVTINLCVKFLKIQYLMEVTSNEFCIHIRNYFALEI